MPYNSSGDFITIQLISVVIGLIVSVVFGCITKGINENKGYEGGFAWGFWLGWIGIIVVSCRQPVQYTPRESIIVPAGRSTTLPQQAITYDVPPADSWKCRCGRYNARYISSCACGLSKREATTNPAAVPISTISVATVSPSPAVSAHKATDLDEEFKTISALKEYKMLLDTGVITQEEFDAKKKAILSQ